MGFWCAQRAIVRMEVGVDKRLEKIQKSSYLLPDPGGEVVRGLVDEVDRLQGAATAWFGKARDRTMENGRLRLAISHFERSISPTYMCTRQESADRKRTKTG